jgi:hypothetical protein
MIVVADNDLILKLAQCDLLKDIHVLLGLEDPTQIFVLPTARFQLIPKSEQKALNKAGSAVVLDAIKLFLQQTNELPHIGDESLLNSLEGIAGIDGGEQLLLASMTENDTSILATGDKRALKAVVANQQLAAVYESLCDRVLTFESALLLALVQFGFPNLKQRLLGNPKPDGVLRLVLKAEMNEGDLVDCLVSYCKEHFQFLTCKARLEPFFNPAI